MKFDNATFIIISYRKLLNMCERPAMDAPIDKLLAQFEKDLSEIVGDDLARDLVQYGRTPSVVEAKMLIADVVETLSKDEKYAIIGLIEENCE
ncbi:MAG: hypothetical protein CMM76_15280 [Rhodospirillaceae bacterium]|nr:hypothetical protein [Rhodospirillaceae bacterium]